METTQKVLLTESISINTEMIKAELGNSSDLLERELVLPYLKRKVHLIYLDGINDTSKIEDYILSPLATISVKE